jgi:predicted transcriptional regulator
LGSLEDAIMQALWEAGDWLTIRDIRDQMDYGPVAYTTVATVTGILSEKDLLVGRQAHRERRPGPAGLVVSRCAADD